MANLAGRSDRAWHSMLLASRSIHAPATLHFSSHTPCILRFYALIIVVNVSCLILPTRPAEKECEVSMAFTCMVGYYKTLQ
ncbi:hypothetical protein CBOM_07386 [Ceraceosorus bombacis]|uniref:Uncharacterized protein n=1 Tax=Ceraceosorus bombacis TaxID=401625 RepID=A0A0P1BA79_9BASI|nr:hypothetical protein CBOM_07386 [Ceraceosorus bombacis]